MFIDPLEKGNLISHSTVDALFSNWRSLLGLNQELLLQLEELPKQQAELLPTTKRARKMSESRDPKILVRVTFQREKASKTLLVNTRQTGNDVIQLAKRKVAASLPATEQESFHKYYEYCELYDEKTTYCLRDGFIDQLQPTGTPPSVVIRKAQKRATDIGECFLQLVCSLYSFLFNLK